MAITPIKHLSLDEGSVQELYCKILEIPSLRGQFWDITSAEVVELVWKKIVNTTKNKDPLCLLKLKQNKRIMEAYPFLKRVVDEAHDPLYTAVKLAILGNAIDVMINDKGMDIENLIEEQLKIPLSRTMYGEFEKRVKESRLLVIFGDNAGEIVFDKLLIETIKNRHDMEVVFIVRGEPTLNDVTVNEARSMGMGEIAAIVENGIDGPCPGTILPRCSEEVNELVKRADLIISKGGGNFDTLDEEKRGGLKTPISFMLLSKCEPYSEYLNVGVGLPILSNAF
jgi:hypothetical protein